LVLLFATMAASILLGAGVALAATTQTFTNTAPITIPDLGPATPYPSPITVAGATGQVRDVDVILDGFSHTFPDDVNILLEGPQGQKALIMADAGAAALPPTKPSSSTTRRGGRCQTPSASRANRTSRKTTMT
jgi:hypothetical protein